MKTHQQQVITAMEEPVYQVASVAFNQALAWRRFTAAAREALIKNGYPFQTRPGLFETAQSVYARPRANLQSVQSQLMDLGTVNLVPTSRG